MSKSGREYENFVGRLQRAIFKSEEIAKQKNIIIEQNKKIIDKNGVKREFDLYWEYELGGFTYKNIIECKDYDSKISIEKIDALLGKLHDIPDLKGIFATNTGYQSGALIKAKENNINDSDWIDEDGIPLTKIIHFSVIGYTQASITNFQPYFDINWVKENSDIDITKPFSICGLNDEIFIDDIEKGEKYSLYDLAYKLADLENNIPGNYNRVYKFSNAFIIWKNTNVKIAALKIEYCIHEPLKTETEIDFSKELLGVIEYLHKGKKVRIFKDGNIQ